MVLEPGVREDPGVHPRVEGLDAPVEALGEAGDLLDLRHREPEALDGRSGTSRGDELDAGLGEAPDEALQPGLVEDGDEGTADGVTVWHGYSWRSLAARMGAPRRAMHLDVVTPRW